MPSTTALAIVDYYRDTIFDYRWVLGLDRHLGIHFGYHDERARSIPDAIINMNAVLAAEAHIKPGMRVLDAGCGSGGSCVWMAKHLGAYATGVTIVQVQCARAVSVAKQHGVSHRTDFLVGDYADTGLSSGSFDVVWALESVCYADRKRSFLGEAFRLLKPGGVLVVADGFRRTRDLDEREEWAMRLWLNGWAVQDLDTDFDFMESMKQTGFRSILGRDVTAQVEPFSRWLAKRSRALLPIVRLLRTFRLVRPSQVRNAIAARWQYETLRQELWGYWIFTGRCSAV